MQFSIKLKPAKLEATTKSKLVSKIRNMNRSLRHTLCNLGNGLYDETNKVFYVYNLQKFRRKVKQNKKFNVKQKSELIRPGHWVAYVYKIDEGLLKTLGKKVRQGIRNFKLEK
jgi:hypothetical protein